MKHFYEFEAFRIEPEKRLLWKNDEAIRLKPKTFDTLLFLLKNRHKVVTKEEIINEIWSGTAVSDDSLTQQISQIRKILDDKKHHFIATVPGVGYEFIADVREVNQTDGNGLANSEQDGDLSANKQTYVAESNLSDLDEEISEPLESKQPKLISDNSSQTNWRAWTGAFVAFVLIGAITLYVWQWQKEKNATALGVKTIAVLPFKTFNPEPESDLLKMAMADALITRLSRIEEIKVLPTSLVSRFNKPDQDPIAAGRELNVDAVLEGHVQKEGNRLRVTAQLIRVSDANTIWAESYEEDFSGIFDVQYELARKIAEALSLRLSDEEKQAMMKLYTSSPEAYRLWLEGVRLFSSASAGGGPQTVELARTNFIYAIYNDPKFALAYVSLANSYISSPPEGMSVKDSLLKAKETVKQALEIDESLPEAHATYAFSVWRGEWNWVEAEEHFQRAVDLGGEAHGIYSRYSLLLSGLGKHEKAMAVAQKNPRLQQFSHITSLGLAFIAAREYDKAIEIFDHALQKMPTLHETLLGMSWAYTGKGDYNQAINFIEKDLALATVKKSEIRSIQAFILAKAGRENEARKTIAELREAAKTEKNLNGGLAIAYGALGERDRAFAYLERAIEEREWWCYLLKVHLMYDPLRDDPRFEEMLRRINLAE